MLSRALAILFLFGLASSGSVRALELPPWQQLVFEQRNFWATARGEVTLKKGVAPLFPDLASDPFLRLEIQNTVGSSIESIVVDLAAGDAASLARWRLSRGRDQRLKTHRYLADAILRERREPASAPAGDNGRNAFSAEDAGWVSSGVTRLELPPAADTRALLSPHALFLLVPRLLQEPSLADDDLVHTDLNFYRLSATPLDGDTLRAEFRLDGKKIEGERRVLGLRLRVEPVPGNDDDPDFELMGLSGDITFLVDTATGLPLRISGKAPRIGGAELNLIEAHSRPAPARAAPAAGLP